VGSETITMNPSGQGLRVVMVNTIWEAQDSVIHEYYVKSPPPPIKIIIFSDNFLFFTSVAWLSFFHKFSSAAILLSFLPNYQLPVSPIQLRRLSLYAGSRCIVTFGFANVEPPPPRQGGKMYILKEISYFLRSTCFKLLKEKNENLINSCYFFAVSMFS
jgi:hypothetical protein